MKIKPMKTEIEAAIKNLTTLVTKDSVKPDDALKFTQAALNRAHVLQVQKQTNLPAN